MTIIQRINLLPSASILRKRVPQQQQQRLQLLHSPSHPPQPLRIRHPRPALGYLRKQRWELGLVSDSAVHSSLLWGLLYGISDVGQRMLLLLGRMSPPLYTMLQWTIWIHTSRKVYLNSHNTSRRSRFRVTRESMSCRVTGELRSLRSLQILSDTNCHNDALSAFRVLIFMVMYV